MSTFDELRQAIGEARAEVDRHEREVVEANERLHRLQRDRAAQVRRGVDPAELDQAIAGQEQALDRLRTAAGRLRDQELDLLGRFEEFSDPTEQMGRLTDRIPICLVPLRLEYRFKRAGEPGGPTDSDELWLRAYPDDFSVDSFEHTLTETEAADARTYWASVWSSGGDESAQRGAWKALLAGQGSGRSFWVTQHYAPLNPEDQPEPPPADPWVILSIPTRAPLAEPELSAVRTYWTAVWHAGEDLAALVAADDALDAAVGAARAEELRQQYPPRNLAAEPPQGATREDTTVLVAFLHFPTDDEAQLRVHGWASTPQARLLPDRLVMLGFRGGKQVLQRVGRPIPATLAVAPDPSASEEDQIQPDGDDLKVGPELAWITDFPTAVDQGMGFRVPLQDADQEGFDELMVLGVRLRSDPEAERLALEELLEHHHHAKSGLSVLPQGRPTNNADGDRSDYRWTEDSDVSFDHYFGTPPADPVDWFAKRDGRWLAEMLGLDPAAVSTVPFYGRTDLADAKAMNVALWPATLGYFLESMLHPIVGDDTVRRTREFFTRHVSGRGALPAIRVGRQPYGILPATPRSRLRWLARGRDDTGDMGDQSFLRQLYGHLRTMEEDVAPLLDRVSYVGKPSADPQQVLLDVVGLHPGSVEFQQRYAESATALYNRLRLAGGGSAFLASLIVLGYTQSGLDLLERHGYTHDGESELPDILEKFFTTSPNLLADALVDDGELSETEPVRPSTTAGANYLTWLRAAAATSHDTLRRQEGFEDGVPRALLYHLLRHALDLSYVETSLQLFALAGLVTQSEIAATRREPAFVQVTEASVTGSPGSRWEPLYQREIAVTGDPALRVGDFIPSQLTTMTATAYLQRQLEALDHLHDKPTAVLERCLVEHVDLCTYRLDVWYGGLSSRHLELLRYGPDGPVEGGPAARTGIHLGAWGYLEQVRPQARDLTSVELPADLDAIFNADPTAPPLTRDATNQGYLHAPSLNHAVTAAVLRNGYLSNATPTNPTSLAVNLSSERVRMALSIIEGLKADQSMGALLGYQFERGLHDRHDVEVDEFIYDLRLAFPLAGNRLEPTRTGATDDAGDPVGIGQVEARNVIDGQAFADHLKTHAQTYPFDLDDLPPASPAQIAAISAEAVRLLDIEDAVADLAMAESVHQVTVGNYERAGAVLDTYSKGKFPASPDVVRTPRSGVTLTHRAALHLPVGLAANDPARISPRAKGEPAVDAWLAGVLPDATTVACSVAITDPDGSTTIVHVTQDQLGLSPLDLLMILDADARQTNGGLDDLVEAFVVANHPHRPDATLTIGYRERIPAIVGHVPFFELAALVRPLRDLVLRSRPLRPTDLTLSGDAQESVDLDVALDDQRVTLNLDELDDRRADLEAFATPLQAQLDTDPRPVDQMVTQIDATIAGFVDLMGEVSAFAGLRSGTGAVYADRARIYAGLQATLADLLVRWEQRLTQFDEAIADYDADAGAGDEEKLRALLVAERFLRTENTPAPLPLPDAFRDDLVDSTRVDFVAERDLLAGLATSEVTIGALHDALEARRASIADLDPEPLDLSATVAAVVTLVEDLAGRAASLAAELTTRVAAVQALVDATLTEADPRRRVDSLAEALRLMFGEDFPVVPDIGMAPAVGAEWRAAWGAGPAPDTSILDHQRTTLGRSFPVDEWFTGVARVREKMRSLESTVRLTEAFGTTSPELHPLQFPFRADVPWLALEYPETLPSGDPLVIDEDKLLYTAHFADGFDETARQAGLLLDEWTEVIPSRTEDTGLAFHYDRPNSEPPQTLLLALPADHGEGWTWDDLVDSVRETVDLAKKRAIEPDHLDTTAYARFLPAVISAVSLYPIFPALNFSMVNAVWAALDDDGRSA